MTDKTFSIINDDVLENAVQAARQRIVYVAPGISRRVAAAIAARFHELGTIQVTLILDVDGEVCRLGYGEMEGVELVKSLADQKCLEIRHQPGLRIGLFISDGDTYIYAPTPQLIEAGSTQPDKPNAIVLANTCIASVEEACAVDLAALPTQAEVGRKAVEGKAVEAVKQDLKENPPKEFNVARAERVFNSRIQYVEISVEKYRLSKKVAPISTELMGLTNDQELREQFKNAFVLFKDTEMTVEFDAFDEDLKPMKDKAGAPIRVKYSEKSIDEDRKKIVEDFLYVVPNYGTVVMRRNYPQLHKRIEWWKQRIIAYEREVNKVLEEKLANSIERLIEAVLPGVREHTPRRYLKAGIGAALCDDDLRALLREDFQHQFGQAKQVFSPTVKVVVKDVAFTSTQDIQFKAGLEKVMPRHLVDKLFSVHTAAPEVERAL